MTAVDLKAKRLTLGFRSRNALAKALGFSKYGVEHWEYGRRAVPGWMPRFLQCLENSQPGRHPGLKWIRTCWIDLVVGLVVLENLADWVKVPPSI
jgi:hypothetical protein